MAAYSYVLDAFTALGVQVVGLSVDSAADSAGLRERLQLDVPLVGELAYPDSVDALGPTGTKTDSRTKPRRSSWTRTARCSTSYTAPPTSGG